MEIQVSNNLVSQLAAEAAQPGLQKNRTGATGDNEAAKLDANFGKLIEKALAPANDQAKVEAARHALKNGQLETPEAFQAAAENLLTLGL